MAEVTLAVGGVSRGDLRVVRLTLREALNDLYEAAIQAHAPPDSALEEETPEQPACLTLALRSKNGERRERKLHGIVRSTRLIGVWGDAKAAERRVAYELTLVPRLWLLSRRRGSRIFQNLSIDEVIRKVLADYGIPSAWRLERAYPKREYWTQYEESDLEFVLRIAARAGLVTYFEQPGDDLDPTSAGAQWLSSLGSTAASMGVNAASQAAGALGGVAQAGVSQLGNQALGMLGSAMGAPREIVVFTDSHHAYPAMSLGEPTSFEDLIKQAGVDVGLAAAGQAASAVQAAIGGPLGDLAGEGIRKGMGALSGLAAGESPEIHVRSALGMHDEYGLVTPTRQCSVHSRSFTFREHDERRPQAKLAVTKVGDSPLLDLAALAGSTGLPGGAGGALGGAMGAVGGAGNTAAAGALDGVATAAGAGDVAGVAGQALGAAAGALGALPNKEGDTFTQPFEIYEHHSPLYYRHWEHERENVERMRSLERRDADLFEAESTCMWMESGRRFMLVDHPLGRMNRQVAIVSVEHRVRPDADDATLSYGNRVTFVPADRLYVPPRPPRRYVQACQTAVVEAHDTTGIHTDGGAHVMVRFHWDRGQPEHGYSTCWVRLMQAWAGAGYGALFIPRAGTEVVVVFEGGDPDRPLVIGALYNGINPPPFMLPADKTKSGFKTRSTPGTEGGNELWFEDAREQELIYVRAQRDYKQDVLHERKVDVGADEAHKVGGNRRLHVEGYSEIRNVGRFRANLENDASISFEGNVDMSAGRELSLGITGNARYTVGQNLQDEVTGNRTQATGKNAVVRVGGNLTQVIGSAEASRSYTTHVEGRMQATAEKTMSFSAKDTLQLRCGQTTLLLTPDKAVLTSDQVILQGKGARIRLMDNDVLIHADGKVQAMGQQVLLSSSGAGMALSSEAAVEGSRILLNSPANASDSVEPSEDEPTIIEAQDTEGNPIPGQPYEIHLGDGSVMSGVLDEDGRAEVVLDEDAQVLFPGLRDARQR